MSISYEEEIYEDEFWNQNESDLDSDIESKEIDYPDEPTYAEGDMFAYNEVTNVKLCSYPLINTKTKPIKKVVKPKNANECAICLETCSKNEKNMSCCTSRCGNLFHTTCLLSYIIANKNKNPRCPFCRESGIFYTFL